MKTFYAGKQEVTAMQFNGGWSGDGSAIADWLYCNADFECRSDVGKGGLGATRLLLFHSIGTLSVYEGDWVVRFPNGRLSAIDEESFAVMFSDTPPVSLKPLLSAFCTAQSGEGRYKVELAFQTLKGMQEAHSTICHAVDQERRKCAL